MVPRNVAAALLLLVAMLAASGCVRDERPDGLVNVRAPGVNVRVGRDGTTTVRAPGVAVEANPDEPRVASPRD